MHILKGTVAGTVALNLHRLEDSFGHADSRSCLSHVVTGRFKSRAKTSKTSKGCPGIETLLKRRRLRNILEMPTSLGRERANPTPCVRVGVATTHAVNVGRLRLGLHPPRSVAKSHIEVVVLLFVHEALPK